VKVAEQFAFTEGPAVDKAGNIYFTDQPNDKIWKYDVDGRLSLFMEKTGRSNGMAFNRQGQLISCADEKNQLLIIDANKQTKVLLSGFQGKAFNGPNDLWIDKHGGIYFTDPYYQRSYWTRKQPELPKQNLYYLPKGAREAIIVDSNLVQPNGITGTPDGKTLFVADIRDNKTYRYTIAASGALGNRTLFAGMGSDGMTLDEQGNLYLTGKGVTVYNAAGIKQGTIAVPAGWVGNICFGGRNRKTLFITASTAVYTLAMQVKGVE
ncbi:MAG TPA: SMP-30/gluconolactonase/LRE family protein, partial [Chitinophagaceae bacterium]|nr:SMP-30/gluconolactonase/LRE family protein [Chitinophagaceae bacterium]